MTQPAPLYACLHVREFPAQSLLRLRSELHDRACVVMEGDPPFQKVCSLNVRARALGAAHAMTRVEIDTVPGISILSRSKSEEEATRIALLETAGSFSPRVEDHSSDNTFSCVIDIAGTEKLFGTPPGLGRALFKRMRALGIVASIAISGNVHASIALARGMSLRDPVLFVPPGEEGNALASLPVSVLDLSEEHLATFSSWGVHTLGALAALPEKELIARMGQEGKRLRQLASGDAPHLFQPVEPQLTLCERLDLESPISLLHSLMFVLNKILEQLIARAESHILALASVTIMFKLAGGGSHERKVSPSVATNNRQVWLKLLQLDMENHPPQAAIVGLTLHGESAIASKVQLGLFSPQMPEPARLDVTLARIGKIVGEQNVGNAILLDTNHPENFRVEHFKVPAAEPSASPGIHACLPLRQLRPFESIRVMLRDNRPASFAFRQKAFTVERCFGPWHASGDWWNAKQWGMEQWDVVTRTEEGFLMCCCLLQDQFRNQWQMAGIYD